MTTQSIRDRQFEITVQFLRMYGSIPLPETSTQISVEDESADDYRIFASLVDYYFDQVVIVVQAVVARLSGSFKAGILDSAKAGDCEVQEKLRRLLSSMPNVSVCESDDLPTSLKEIMRGLLLRVASELAMQVDDLEQIVHEGCGAIAPDSERRLIVDLLSITCLESVFIRAMKQRSRPNNALDWDLEFERCQLRWIDASDLLQRFDNAISDSSFIRTYRSPPNDVPSPPTARNLAWNPCEFDDSCLI